MYLVLHACNHVALGSRCVTLPGEGTIRWRPLRCGRNRHHGAERTVAEPEQLGRTTEVCGLDALVLLEDDPVPHAERLGPERALLTQLTRCLAAGPDHVVQRCDVGPPDGQDGGCLVAGCVVTVDHPPVLDDALAGLIDGAGDRHPAVLGVRVDRGGDVSPSQGNEGIALPLLVSPGLAAVSGEGDDVVAQLGRQSA